VNNRLGSSSKTANPCVSPSGSATSKPTKRAHALSLGAPALVIKLAGLAGQLQAPAGRARE
jgi:hypothetical protein